MLDKQFNFLSDQRHFLNFQVLLSVVNFYGQQGRINIVPWQGLPGCSPQSPVLHVASWSVRCSSLQSSVRIAGGVGGLNPPTSPCRPPTSDQSSTRGSSFNPPSPKFCWSWYAAWFTLPSNAVLKISRPASWWFECYYTTSWLILQTIVVLSRIAR